MHICVCGQEGMQRGSSEFSHQHTHTNEKLYHALHTHTHTNKQNAESKNLQKIQMIHFRDCARD